MKQTLIPLQVPWSIAWAVPQLHMTIVENGRATIQFLGKFLNENTDVETHQSHEKVVTVEIVDVVWSRSSPRFSEHSIIDESLYARGKSLTTLYSLSHDESMKYLYEQWVNLKVCPDPQAYKVLDSQWISQHKSKYSMKDEASHYLFHGNDMYIEVIGTKMTWTSSQTW